MGDHTGSHYTAVHYSQVAILGGVNYKMTFENDIWKIHQQPLFPETQSLLFWIIHETLCFNRFYRNFFFNSYCKGCPNLISKTWYWVFLSDPYRLYWVRTSARSFVLHQLSHRCFYSRSFHAQQHECSHHQLSVSPPLHVCVFQTYFPCSADSCGLTDRHMVPFILQWRVRVRTLAIHTQNNRL